MADARLILNDVLCFLLSKIGKTNVKAIKSILLEYYSSPDIAIAKKQLLEDVLQMEMPHTFHIGEKVRVALSWKSMIFSQ
jgi:hypothetical protein